uniref:Trafficking protein particle complex subunit 11 domain-containing protein n=1 Tax=Meloidogyne floridensis TaxID=298350 RepID=A0A915PD79_9BILA
MVSSKKTYVQVVSKDADGTILKAFNFPTNNSGELDVEAVRQVFPDADGLYFRSGEKKEAFMIEMNRPDKTKFLQISTFRNETKTNFEAIDSAIANLVTKTDLEAAKDELRDELASKKDLRDTKIYLKNEIKDNGNRTIQMEPKEIDSRLINNCLRGLIFFNGLELNGKCAHHEAIFNAFTDLKRERSVQCQYKILNYGDEFFKRNNSKKTPPNDSISIKSKPRGIIKYNWQYKYLDERPALIVLFIDLDWDSELWLQQKNECESRLNVLRQSIGQLETKLALVLIQKAKTTVDDSIATEKAIEICQFCKISTRQFYVFPLLTDKKATAECIVRLEIAFYQIAQEAYQAYFKKIRARSVPNNDQQVLLRQQFKLAFISELREDRHSSLRYYKQAYQIAADLEMLELFIYELINIAGFLNYKICELNFILNSPLEALNQFRKHSSNFLNRQMGNYPSKELAIIEFELWKSQQVRNYCLLLKIQSNFKNRLFADLFNFAVSNGVAAYASQNPGRFLEEAASHLKKANSLIRQLKTKNAQQQRQPCSINLGP